MFPATLMALAVTVAAPCQQAPGPSVAEGVRAILMVSVNTTDAGEALVVIREGARDVLLPAALLQSAGLENVRAPQEVIDGRAYVSLASARPKLQFTVDDAALALRITAPAEAFGAQRIDLRPVEPSGTQHRSSFGLFGNYGLNWTDDRRPSLSAEFGASVGPALMVSTLSRAATGVVTRGLSTLTVDHASTMVRFTAGDIAMRGGSLWGAGMVTGAAVSREFSLNPYFTHFPTPRLTQVLSTPATVDVYVNDRLVRRTDMAPGVFDITGIPALAGAGNTRVVVRDAFGRSQTFDTSYYVTSAVLAKGVHDFQYAAGTRQRFTLDGLNHRQAAAVTHRVGLTNSLTIGLHAEGDASLVSGGPSFTARLGPLGDLEGTYGVSRLPNGATGRAAAMAWSYLHGSTSLSWSVRASTGTFVSFGDPHGDATARVEWAASVATAVWGLGPIAVNVQQQWVPPVQSEFSGGWRRLASVAGSRRLSEWIQFQWRVAQTWTPRTRSVEATVGAVVTLGRTSASVAVTRVNHTLTEEVSVARALPAQEGFGYRLRADRDAGQIDGAVQTQTSAIRSEMQVYRLNGRAHPLLLLSGGVVAMGGALKFTNGLGESYAVVEVPGLEGVRVYANNTEVGRTGRDGKLLVPRMLPNYANRLAVSDLDLPADRVVAEAEKLVAPPVRGGAVVVFHQDKIESVTGRVEWNAEDGIRIPAYGVIAVSVADRVVDSPIAVDGVFFLEKVPAGRYTAIVSYRGDECVATLVVPTRTATVIDLGTVSCRPR